VIYGPEYDMWLDGIDPELQAAMARAYNRWGQEMRETSNGVVVTSGPVPLNDVSRAVEEIQYAHEHLGIRCFWARPDQFNHRSLGDRYYDPIYELLQDLDCAFATHEYMGLNAVTAGSDRFNTFTEWHTVVHPHEAQHALLSMIVHGVYERFPRLRTAYMEAGCGWLPSWLHRIDEHLELAGAVEAPELTMSATDYFRRNCWISTECDDRFVSDVIRWMGDGHIVYETDFPHPDSKYPEATDHFLALDEDLVPAESKRKILWDNALDLYRFPDGFLPDPRPDGKP
jgi:predicted TIM-barrel fold metal-dependent hydrolase